MSSGADDRPGSAPARDFAVRGWTRFDTDPAVLNWVYHALPHARAAVIDPALAHWLDCGGTWFVGVDALPNDSKGRIGGSAPLSGRAIDFVTAQIGPIPSLHPAQLSVVYPGYPRPRSGETAGAFEYRRHRDAAHVDGVLAIGPSRRRQVREPHAFILGLPLTPADPDAAPLVVWEGSHEIMRAAFSDALTPHDAPTRDTVDVTSIYNEARRRVFETCARVPLPAQPGQAVLLHRLTLHGVAPWTSTAASGPDGRMIAYFRPQMPGGIHDWLTVP